MTFEEAIATIEEHCQLGEEGQAVSVEVEVMSGGLRASSDDPAPALYATRELAIAAWLTAVLDVIGEHDPEQIVFTEGPHLDKHIMTNQTERHMQRTVEDRFTVTANVGLIGSKATAG